MKLTVFSLLGIVFMASCQQNVSKIDEVVMKRDTLITQFSDSSYFSDIRSMYYYRDNIYLTDYQRSQIIKLNKSGEVIKCLSEKGMGPGEMQGASDLFVKEDSIFVINDFKQCLELFSNSKHLKSIMIPSQTRMATGTRFAYYNNTLYLSSASERNSIVAICQHDNTFKHLGKLIDFGSLTKSKICNNRHLFIKNKKIISISNCEPLIEMYDLTGNLVTEYDLTGIKLIDSRLEYAKTLNLGPNSYAILIPDACLFGDTLYLLITSNDESGPFTNRILVIDINKNSFKVNHILDLGDQWFNTFCVNEDHLWAVSQEGINRFSLN